MRSAGRPPQRRLHGPCSPLVTRHSPLHLRHSVFALAGLDPAIANGSGGLGGFFEENRRAAIGAGLGEHSVAYGRRLSLHHHNLLFVSALGVARAGKEVAETTAFDGHGLSTFLAGLLRNLRRGGPDYRTAILHGDFSSVSALGIARAGKEVAETAALDRHRFAAFLASLFGDLGRGRLGGAIFFGEFRRQVARALAVGVASAGQKRAVPPQSDVHGLPALLAFFFGGDALALDVVHLTPGQAQVLFEFLVEIF